MADPERDRWKAAGHPDPYTLRADQLRRKDVWQQIDRLEASLVEGDAVWDSAIRKDMTNLRAMLATLLPEDPPQIKCAAPWCRIRFTSVRAQEEHVYYVHAGPEPEHMREERERLP